MNDYHYSDHSWKSGRIYQKGFVLCDIEVVAKCINDNNDINRCLYGDILTNDHCTLNSLLVKHHNQITSLTHFKSAASVHTALIQSGLRL